MPRFPHIALLLSFLLPATPGIAQVGKLLPVDEATRDASLFAFRAQLQSAVARHDVDALLAMVDPHIKTGFGGGGGVEGLKKQWGLPGDGSRLWDELGTLLALGGAFQGKDTFVAPYVFSRWPEALDSFQHVAILGSGVRVRAEPNLQSAVLAKLSFDVVRLSDAGRKKLKPEQAKEWKAVELRGGQVGYVSARYARSPVERRAFLSRQGGDWRVTLLVAGD